MHKINNNFIIGIMSNIMMYELVATCAASGQ